MIKRNFKTLAAFAKKGLIIAAACAISLPAFAEGYQINSQSARQWGMAHTGTALKLGAESMLFNPAGLAYMDSKFDISLGTIAIKSKVKFEQEGYSNQTDNPLSTPIFGHIGFKLGKNLAAGINITNPAGNSLVWGDNWKGATLVQDVSLKAFCIQPTISYKIGKVLSIGAGLMIDFGSFSQNKGLVAVGQFDPLAPLAQGLSAVVPQFAGIPAAIQSFSGQTPAGISLEGNSKVSYGVNVGILVNVSPKITLGATYRSTVKLSVEEGNAKLAYANDNAKALINQIASLNLDELVSQLPGAVLGQLPAGTLETLRGTQGKLQEMLVMEGAKFAAEMPIPSIISAGIAYTPNEKWTITGEAQFTQWSEYKNLDLKFTTLAFPEKPITQSFEKNYKNTVAVRLGAEYDACDFVTVRAGVYMDTPPVQMDNYNPETPSANAYGVTAGATLNPTKFLAIDLAVGYLQGEKTTGSCNEGAFKADYTKSAIMPGVGLRFKF